MQSNWDQLCAANTEHVTIDTLIAILCKSDILTKNFRCHKIFKICLDRKLEQPSVTPEIENTDIKVYFCIDLIKVRWFSTAESNIFSKSNIFSQLSIGDSAFLCCHTSRKVPIQDTKQNNNPSPFQDHPILPKEKYSPQKAKKKKKYKREYLSNSKIDTILIKI